VYLAKSLWIKSGRIQVLRVNIVVYPEYGEYPEAAASELRLALGEVPANIETQIKDGWTEVGSDSSDL